MSDGRRSALLGVLALLLFFGAGTLLVARFLLGTTVPLIPGGGRVAVLPLEGVLSSEERLVRALDRYREESDVRAFVLRIRSPGGTVGASQSLYREIRRLREEDDRPVVAWIGDVGASGGYYVALAADSIFALPGSITGSIGVIMQFPNARELLRKAGVELEVVKSGAHKDMGSPVRPLSEADRDVLQTLVNDVYDQFVGAVAEERGLDRERALRLADGRVVSGARAVELGLVDGVGTFSETLDLVGRMTGLGPDPRTVRPGERRLGILDLLRGIEEERIRAWLDWLPDPSATPRLLYQWR